MVLMSTRTKGAMEVIPDQSCPFLKKGCPDAQIPATEDHSQRCKDNPAYKDCSIYKEKIKKKG